MIRSFSRTPFGRLKLDPLEFMLERVEEEALSHGFELSPAQRNWLAAEGRADLTEAEYERLRGLVGRIVERERGQQIPESQPSFCGAIEWAGDQVWPNVVELAVSILSGYPPHRSPFFWEGARDRVALVLTALLLVLGMFVVAVLLSLRK